MALSEDLRAKVLDLLFGAEEEFDYSSTTTPAEPAPAQPAPGASEPDQRPTLDDVMTTAVKPSA